MGSYASIKVDSHPQNCIAVNRAIGIHPRDLGSKPSCRLKWIS